MDYGMVHVMEWYTHCILSVWMHAMYHLWYMLCTHTPSIPTVDPLNAVHGVHTYTLWCCCPLIWWYLGAVPSVFGVIWGIPHMRGAHYAITYRLSIVYTRGRVGVSIADTSKGLRTPLVSVYIGYRTIGVYYCMHIHCM